MTFLIFGVDSKLCYSYNTVNDRITQLIQFRRKEARRVISFQDFRQTDGTPIYLQIVRYIQQGLAAGTI